MTQKNSAPPPWGLIGMLCSRRVNKCLVKCSWCNALTTGCQQLWFVNRDRKHRRHWMPRNEDPTVNTRLGEMSTANSYDTAVRQRAAGQQHPQSSMHVVGTLLGTGHGKYSEKGTGLSPRSAVLCQLQHQHSAFLLKDELCQNAMETVRSTVLLRMTLFLN